MSKTNLFIVFLGLVIGVLVSLSLLSWKIQNSPSVVSSCEDTSYFAFMLCQGKEVLQYKPQTELNIDFLNQDSEDNVTDIIDALVNSIEENLETATRTEVDDHGKSAEGGVIVYSSFEDSVKKMEATYFGETGKMSLAFYYDNEGQLIFIHQENHSYNRPITWDEETAAEFNDDQVFDPEKTTIIANDFYFDPSNALHAWLLTDTQESTEQTLTQEKEQELLTQSEELLLKRSK